MIKAAAPRPAFLAAFVLYDSNMEAGQNASDKTTSLFSYLSPDFQALVASVESKLQDRMPAYMMPSVFIPLPCLPLTATGKTDRRRLREATSKLSQAQLDEYGPAAASGTDEHCMPSMATEEALQGIWARVLNRPAEQISMKANFLRLGGDSISAMQLSSQSRAAGYACSVADIFKYKNIAAIASIVGSGQAGLGSGNFNDVERVTKEEQEKELQGESFTLSPIQQVFFDEVPAAFRHHYNQSFLLRLSQTVALEDISSAVHTLISRHGMLRTRFYQADGDWVQATVQPDGSANSPVDQQRAASYAEAQSIMASTQQSLIIEQGRVFQVNVIHVDGDGQYIFMVAHHLVIDLVSWRVILDDLESLLTTGNKVAIPSLSSLSFRTWCRLQQDYSRAQLSPDSVLSTPLPPSCQGYWCLAPEQNAFRDGIDTHFTLDENVTSVLLGPANEAFGSSIADILHAALLHSFVQTFQGRSAPVVFSEGHGREPWDASTDVFRTVGWFTTLWPTYVPATAQMDLADIARRIKDGRRQIPGNGWAYFASRYLNPEGRHQLNTHGLPEITFNYLGQFQQLEREGAILQPSKSLTKTADISPHIPRPTIFDISASVSQGRLQMEFSRSRHLPQSMAIRDWISRCEMSLLQIAESFPSRPQSFTLCDLPLLRLSGYGDLDQLLQSTNQIGVAPADIANVCPCSPIQQCILLAKARDPTRYITREVGRVLSTTHGPVDMDQFQRAWQTVVDRHAILRTVFTENPGPSSQGYWVQLVLKPGASAADMQAVHHLEPSGTTMSVDMDMAMGTKRPAHRLVLCRQSDGVLWYELSIHHALVDGMSSRLIQQDLVRAYDEMLSESTSNILPYPEYIAYLQQQSETDSREYWFQYLDGVEACHFPALVDHAPPGLQERNSVDASLALPVHYSGILSRVGVTLANIVQLAWALTIRCYTGADSVCFAYLTSGRDIPLRGIDQAVGPFINLLASRIDLPEHASLQAILQGVQADYTAALDHQHCSLADVLHGMDLDSRTLFNTGISIQSVLDTSPNNNETPSIALDVVHGDDAVDFDLTLNVSLHRDAVTMTLNYSNHILGKLQASEVANLFCSLVSEVIDHSELPLGQLPSFSTSHEGRIWRHFSGRRRSDEYWRNHSAHVDSATGFPSLPAGDYVSILDGWLQSSLVPIKTIPEPSVLLRASWAIVQAHHTNSDNVVFAMETPGQELIPCCLQIFPHDSVDNVLSAIRCHDAEAVSLPRAKSQSLLKQLPGHAVAFYTERAPEQLSKQTSQKFSHSLIITTSVRQDDSFQLMAQFDSRVLDQIECKRLLQHIEQVFHSIAHREPDQKVKEVPVISPADLAQLREWNRDIPTPVNRCVHDVVLDRCDDYPAAMAVSAWDGCLSYGQLRDLSARLAAHLLEQSGGLVEAAKVPVCMEKSQWVPVAILGVLRAGATCVMIDPSHPPQRIRELTRDLDAPLAVVSSSGASAIQDFVQKSFMVSSSMLSSLPVHSSVDSPLPPGNPGSPAFIVFTSGSTGKPKGIVMLHANVSTGLRDLSPSHNVTKGLRMLHFASYAFDASLAETFFALSSGSCLCVPSAVDRTNNLSGFIRDQRIDWAILTPSAAAVLHPADVPSLRTLLLVGEPLPSRAVDLWAADRTLINGYGPAETTFACAVGRVLPHGWKPGTIGPVVNGLGWITTVSDTSRLAAIGAVGELLVEGPAVTAGYLNEPEKTAASFVRGPKWLRELRDGDPAAARLYRTGDLVQYTSNGAIRFVGRRDNQVKLNGQRIELGEVEHNIQSGIPEGSAVVAELFMPAGDHARPLLAAFVCLRRGQVSSSHSGDLLTAPNATLRSQLEAARAHALLVLPRHMVPAAFVPLNYIPSSIAGKTDRRRLLELANSMSRVQMGRFMESGYNAASSLPPSTAPERKLQQLFAQALEIPPETISANDSFFELGGDSIGAMALVSMARRADAAFSIADIFRSPRLTDLASVMTAASESALSKEVSNGGKPNLEQKINLYFSSHLGLPSKKALLDSVQHSCFSQPSTSISQIVEVLPVTGFQNMELRDQPCIYRILHLEGALHYDRLEAACQALVQRHTILRAVFRLQGDTALQMVHERPVVRLQRLYQVTENPKYTEQVCALLDNDMTQFNTPITQFTLIQGPRPNQHHLIIRLSHAQYDGLSMPILYHDLGCLYRGSPLSPAPPYTVYMEHWLDAQTNPHALSYWRGMLEASTMTYLRDPHGRQVDSSSHAEEMDTLIVAQGRTHIGNTIQKQTGTTMATVVKAAWAAVLVQLTQQQDVTFAQMANTRTLDAPDFSNIVGPCINPIPVRIHFQSSWTVLDLLQSIQDQQANSVPFNMLDYRNIVDHCSPWARGTLFGSLVTHQNIDTGSSSFCIGDVECVSVDGSTGHKLHLPPPDTVMITTFPSTDGSNVDIEVEALNRTIGQGFANDIVRRMQDVIHRFVNGPGTRLSELLS